MYLIKALLATTFQVSADIGGRPAQWASGERRIVDDSALAEIQRHPDVFEVVAGPIETDVMAAVMDYLIAANGFGSGDWRLMVGSGAPVDAVRATATLSTFLTFTAVAYGTAINGRTIRTVQATDPSVALSVTVTAGVITIMLPSDGNGDPVTKTSAQVKTAWDASAGAAIATVARTGDGTDDIVVDSTTFSGGIAGTGQDVAGKGSEYVDTAAPSKYFNTGSKAAPAWTEQVAV